ncbi:ribonuclease domain-containing protein, partial [Stomatobaculum longum]|uniref:ribonuclease domain-containing protein n=1 Tax=Stomatobaculum longum TaxID=796942 RepID=UPI0028DB8C7A
EETRAAKKSASEARASERGTESGSGITEDGTYTSRDEVALYLHSYGKLPKNFISKKEAEEQGFRFGEGDFGEAFPGMSVGGSRFGNYEGQLPEKSGRRYYECDIDYQGGRRNAKRLVYSNDGLIFYTDDHYKSFTQLY